VKRQRALPAGVYFLQRIRHLRLNDFPSLIVGDIFRFPPGTFHQHVVAAFINRVADFMKVFRHDAAFLGNLTDFHMTAPFFHIKGLF